MALSEIFASYLQSYWCVIHQSWVGWMSDRLASQLLPSAQVARTGALQALVARAELIEEAPSNPLQSAPLHYLSKK